MVVRRLDSKRLWQYSHSASIFAAVLLFTAGFLCVLLWTNGLVNTPTSADRSSSTFTSISPAVSTFDITYNVAIFGVAWNAIFFVLLLILERDVVPLSTTTLRYEVEKAACIVAVAGNVVYCVACIALMATLARLASDATSVVKSPLDDVAKAVAASAPARRAGQGTTAAMAGLAAVTAAWACVMDALHAQDSQYRRTLKEEPIRERAE